MSAQPAVADPPQQAVSARLERVSVGSAQRALTIFVDHVTVSMMREFEACGIGSLLLKGPGFARLFYGVGQERTYTDTDLLIRCEQLAAAEQLLERLGFVRVDRDEDWLGREPKYAHTFCRLADNALLDLHWRLAGASAASAELWVALTGHTMPLELCGQQVRTLDRPASALLAALHSAHHGSGRASTLADLDLAVTRLEFDEWIQATRLAEQIGATRALAAGLRLTAAGDRLADRLGLSRPATVEMWLKVNPATHGAWVLDRIAQTGSWRARAMMALRVLFPPRAVMRSARPLARRGQIGLAAAYLMQPLRLALHAPASLQGWMRARRAVRHGLLPTIEASDGRLPDVPERIGPDAIRDRRFGGADQAR